MKKMDAFICLGALIGVLACGEDEQSGLAVRDWDAMLFHSAGGPSALAMVETNQTTPGRDELDWGLHPYPKQHDGQQTRGAFPSSLEFHRHNQRFARALAAPSGTCAYPISDSTMEEGTIMPEFQWRRSFGGRLNGAPLTMRKIYCGHPGIPARRYVILLFGASWCESSVDGLRALNRGAYGDFGQSAVIIYIEVGTAETQHTASTVQARAVASRYAPNLNLVGAGDVDNVVPMAASRAISTVPTIVLVERATMKVIIRGLGTKGFTMVQAFLDLDAPSISRRSPHPGR
ncbi:MAG: hypothetical protein VX589_09105 [Myxococcota bacterium]|nr:hypothetical protein [Myxococcota bacterium]